MLIWTKGTGNSDDVIELYMLDAADTSEKGTNSSGVLKDHINGSLLLSWDRLADGEVSMINGRYETRFKNDASSARKSRDWHNLKNVVVRVDQVFTISNFLGISGATAVIRPADTLSAITLRYNGKEAGINVTRVSNSSGTAEDIYMVTPGQSIGDSDLRRLYEQMVNVLWTHSVTKTHLQEADVYYDGGLKSESSGDNVLNGGNRSTLRANGPKYDNCEFMFTEFNYKKSGDGPQMYKSYYTLWTLIR